MNTSQASQEVLQPSQGARSIFNLAVLGSSDPAEPPGGAAAAVEHQQHRVSASTGWGWSLVLTNPGLSSACSILLCLPSA